MALEDYGRKIIGTQGNFQTICLTASGQRKTERPGRYPKQSTSLESNGVNDLYVLFENRLRFRTTAHVRLAEKQMFIEKKTNTGKKGSKLSSEVSRSDPEE